MSKGFDIQKLGITPGAWAGDNSILKAKTKVRVSLPEETRDLKMLELAQITAPGGLTIEFKLPFAASRSMLSKLADIIKSMGGTVEIEE